MPCRIQTVARVDGRGPSKWRRSSGRSARHDPGNDRQSGKQTRTRGHCTGRCRKLRTGRTRRAGRQRRRHRHCFGCGRADDRQDRMRHDRLGVGRGRHENRCGSRCRPGIGQVARSATRQRAHQGKQYGQSRQSQHDRSPEVRSTPASIMVRQTQTACPTRLTGRCRPLPAGRCRACRARSSHTGKALH
jgi:hypothetical protein